MVADFGKVDLMEREVNARLIAAAPELHVRLKELVEIIEKARHGTIWKAAKALLDRLEAT